jgi:hypothetical protein
MQESLSQKEEQILTLTDTVENKEVQAKKFIILIKNKAKQRELHKHEIKISLRTLKQIFIMIRIITKKIKMSLEK